MTFSKSLFILLLFHFVHNCCFTWRHYIQYSRWIKRVWRVFHRPSRSKARGTGSDATLHNVNTREPAWACLAVLKSWVWNSWHSLHDMFLWWLSLNAAGRRCRDLQSAVCGTMHVWKWLNTETRRPQWNERRQKCDVTWRVVIIHTFG